MTQVFPVSASRYLMRRRGTGYGDRKDNQPAQHEFSARLTVIRDNVDQLVAALKEAVAAHAGLEKKSAGAMRRVAALSQPIEDIDKKIEHARSIKRETVF